MNYLLVTKWQGEKVFNSAGDLEYDKFKQVNCQGKKATLLGKQYELELNKGIDFSITTGRDNLLKSLQDNTLRYSVCAIPFSQAREYRNFPDWMDCPLFKPK